MSGDSGCARRSEAALKSHRSFWRLLLVCWLLALGWSHQAQAQLATSFLSVTNIRVRNLPNAVQLRIETDGTVRFGGDASEWDHPTQSLRLRIAEARSKLPIYVPIDSYPIDGAAISLGSRDFTAPVFTPGVGPDSSPRVEIEILFAAPVNVVNFQVQPSNSHEYLGPRQAAVETSPDRRAILITVVPDRSDTLATRNLDRSPRDSRKQRLNVSQLDDGSLSVDALHVPLRQLLGEVSRVSNNRFLARDEVADLPTTLFLNRASVEDVLEALQLGMNLGVKEDEGFTVLGRGDDFFTSRTLALQNLSPDSARLLYPDFLLPYLRPDRQNNKLLAVQTPSVLNKIQHDLARIDTPRAQFEVGAQIWQIASTRDASNFFQFVRSIGGDRQEINPATGQLVVRVQEGQTRQLFGTLQALSARGQSRLLGNPRVSLLSGVSGSLFLGQTRFIKVLQQQGSNQVARALPLQIGTSLNVTARGSNTPGEKIALDISPQLSSIDAIEDVTGLPTLAIRQISSSLWIGEGDTILVAGLDSDLDFSTQQKLLRLLPNSSKNREVSQLVALVTARRISSSSDEEATANQPMATDMAINGELARMQP